MSMIVLTRPNLYIISQSTNFLCSLEVRHILPNCSYELFNPISRLLDMALLDIAVASDTFRIAYQFNGYRIVLRIEMRDRFFDHRFIFTDQLPLQFSIV